MSVPLVRINGLSVAAREFVDARTVRIRMGEGVDPNQVIETVQKLFDDLFREGITYVFFDMQNVETPNASFIAMLVQRAVEARRMNGEVRLVNLSVTARNHLAMFSPLTYLPIGEDEAFGSELPVAPEGDDEETYALDGGIPYKLQLTSTLDALNKLTDFVSTLARSAGFEKLEVNKLKIAIYEAGMNVIEHGYEFDTEKTMDIEVLKETDRFLMTLTDMGKSFDFYGNPVYDVEEAFHEKRQGGFGRYIIERAVDEVYYQSDEKGNRLTLVKYMNKN
jgi:serine/threonine-protein kinase RsbW